MTMTMAEGRVRFESRFRELQGKARRYFADYKPESKDEAVANSLFLTWHHFHKLVTAGRGDDALLTSTFYFSCRQTRSGRMMRAAKGSKSRELYDHARKAGAAIITGIDLDAFIGKRNTVVDIVAFRVDTLAWIDSLTENQRQRAMELADGTSTSELARRWNVSPAAVSLYRRQLNLSYPERESCPGMDARSRSSSLASGIAPEAFSLRRQRSLRSPDQIPQLPGNGSNPISLKPFSPLAAISSTCFARNISPSRLTMSKSTSIDRSPVKIFVDSGASIRKIFPSFMTAILVFMVYLQTADPRACNEARSTGTAGPSRSFR
jgi:hypothetical protein